MTSTRTLIKIEFFGGDRAPLPGVSKEITLQKNNVHKLMRNDYLITSQHWTNRPEESPSSFPFAPQISTGFETTTKRNRRRTLVTASRKNQKSDRDVRKTDSQLDEENLEAYHNGPLGTYDYPTERFQWVIFANSKWSERWIECFFW